MSTTRQLETPTNMFTLKTPATARVRQQFNYKPLPLVDSIAEEDQIDPLEELLKKTWNIWGVSPLYLFEYKSERHLKLYAKRLREELASLLPKENVKYDVIFEVSTSIDSRPNNLDPPAFKIEVFTEDLEKEIKKCIYTGVLISWGSSIAESNEADDTSVKLPLLLCRGNKTAITAVNITLMSMFDCIIVELAATEEDLKWLVPIVLSIDDKHDEVQVKFEYKLPGLPASDDITLTLEASALSELWNVITESDDVNTNYFLLRHVERFHQVLQKQIWHDSEMQLGFSKLTKISLPYITIMGSRMKASTSEVLHKVLLYFTEKSMEILHLLNFDTTRSSINSNT